MKTVNKLGSAIVDFTDHNSVWREKGNLSVIEFANKSYFLLENDEGGRVFPLSHRRAEVYLNESEKAYIVEHDYNMANWQSIQEQV